MKADISKLSFAEILKLSRKSDDTSDPIDVLITDKLAMLMTLLFIRIGVSANMISVMSLLFSIIGSFFIYPDNLKLNLIGIALELFALVLDNSDGQVARLTGTSSQIGRILDGFCDSVGFCSVLIGLSFRLMHEPIPFLNGKLWGGWIWVLMIVYYSYFYPSQCSMADYYRNVHLFFLNPNKTELTGSDAILESIRQTNSETPVYDRIFLKMYYMWTRLQERQTPKLQRLLGLIRKRGEVPQALAEHYVQMSRKYIICTSLLTYYLREFTLFIMIILRIHAFFFPFAIIVLGAIEGFMIAKYEAITEKLAVEAE